MPFLTLFGTLAPLGTQTPKMDKNVTKNVPKSLKKGSQTKRARPLDHDMLGRGWGGVLEQSRDRGRDDDMSRDKDRERDRDKDRNMAGTKVHAK